MKTVLTVVMARLVVMINMVTKCLLVPSNKHAIIATVEQVAIEHIVKVQRDRALAILATRVVDGVARIVVHDLPIDKVVYALRLHRDHVGDRDFAVKTNVSLHQACIADSSTTTCRRHR